MTIYPFSARKHLKAIEYLAIYSAKQTNPYCLENEKYDSYVTEQRHENGSVYQYRHKGDGHRTKGSEVVKGERQTAFSKDFYEILETAQEVYCQILEHLDDNGIAWLDGKTIGKAKHLLYVYKRLRDKSYML